MNVVAEGFEINGHRCFVEIEYNKYLPATPENVEKARKARFLEQLTDKAVVATEECDHVRWYDEEGFIYHQRLCVDCGKCIEMI